jgi:hypothetical protein
MIAELPAPAGGERCTTMLGGQEARNHARDRGRMTPGRVLPPPGRARPPAAGSAGLPTDHRRTETARPLPGLAGHRAPALQVSGPPARPSLPHLPGG